MDVIVPIKRVPDTAGEKRIDADTRTTDRDGVETVLNPLDEWSIEEALRLREAGTASSIRCLMVGPEDAQPIVRKALAYGLDGAVHVADDGIAGSDALGTARVIAEALRQQDWDLVIFGNQSTDARTCLVPAAVAELLGVPGLTYARHLEIDGERIVVHRETDEGWDVVEATLPAVVSVVEAINEPRYPSFKGIMAAKKKPIDSVALADLDVEADSVGHAGATAVMFSFAPRPPKPPGTIVEDDGSGSAAAALAQWMQDEKFV